MFRKRIKKDHPPGTFIPTPIRVFAIVHLCLAFTLILWNAGVPFMGDLYEIKSKRLLFDEVMGHELFPSVSQEKQSEIVRHYQKLQTQLDTSFQKKILQSFEKLLFDLPLFKQAWLLFSVVISIQLLLKVEGAAQAIWLLPLLAAVYGLDNRLSTQPATPTRAEQLFPSEMYLIENYIKKPLSENILEQKIELSNGWNRYLIDQWDPAQSNARTGEFYFNLERLKRTIEEPPLKQQKREPLLFLALYFFWNISYAIFAVKFLPRPRFRHHLLN